MPTYEYGCDSCGKQWELEQRISADPIRKCPKCGKMKAKRLISGGGNFILKGGGWYSDLYHKPATPKKSGETSSPSTTSESTPATASESKADSKPSDSKPKKAKTPKKATAD